MLIQNLLIKRGSRFYHFSEFVVVCPMFLWHLHLQVLPFEPKWRWTFLPRYPWLPGSHRRGRWTGCLASILSCQQNIQFRSNEYGPLWYIITTRWTYRQNLVLNGSTIPNHTPTRPTEGLGIQTFATNRSKPSIPICPKNKIDTNSCGSNNVTIGIPLNATHGIWGKCILTIRISPLIHCCQQGWLIQHSTCVEHPQIGLWFAWHLLNLWPTPKLMG